MSDTSDPWPEEGELLVCTVKGVKENGAYLNLNGYGEREGFVFIGEVAAGWVKNIRAHLREGQRVVAKVVNIKKDRQRVDLSIKAVSAERKKRHATNMEKSTTCKSNNARSSRTC